MKKRGRHESPNGATRQSILNLLICGPQTAAAIAEVMNVTPQAAAYHLRKLEEEDMTKRIGTAWVRL